jgi:hypothetical protein
MIALFDSGRVALSCYVSTTLQASLRKQFPSDRFSAPFPPTPFPRFNNFPERLLEPIREVMIQDEGVGARRLSMTRIMARRTKAAALRA